MNTKKILVYPIGGVGEMRVARLLELELTERGAAVTGNYGNDICCAVFVTGVVNAKTAEIMSKLSESAETVCCYREIEADTNGVLMVERPFDTPKLCDGLMRLYKKSENDKRGLEIDGNAVLLRGERVTLSKKELALLKLLISRDGEAVSREEAQKEVFGLEGDSNAVDVYIRYLRKKLDLRFDTRMIITVRNKGYMFKEP